MYNSFNNGILLNKKSPQKKNEPDLSSINSNDNASDVIDDKEMLNVWDK